MPPAALIPIAIAGASMVASNVQQKSANKNNLNQQAGEVQNSQAAYANAEQQMQQLIASNPSPFAGQQIARPTGNYGGAVGAPAGGVAQQVMRPTSLASPATAAAHAGTPLPPGHGLSLPGAAMGGGDGRAQLLQSILGRL